MSTLYLESEANARVKRWKKLAADARSIRRERATLLEGIHLLQTALEHPQQAKISALMLAEESATAEARALAESAARAFNAPLFVLAERLYAAISPVEHGAGCMAEMAIPEPAPIERWANEDALYLDGVQDAGNAGTLIRTAAASGVKVVAASVGTAALWTPKVLRAGMGAHFSVQIAEGVSPQALSAGYRGLIAAADARGGEDLFAAADYAEGPVCWIMGAEGPGVSEAALAAARCRFYIPIEAGVESLNVGAAAAVCLFDARRRRLERARRAERP